jgi:hypothetical protein
MQRRAPECLVDGKAVRLTDKTRPHPE